MVGSVQFDVRQPIKAHNNLMMKEDPFDEKDVIKEDNANVGMEREKCEEYWSVDSVCT